MGFHSLLAGQDLHEPSRVRVVNNTTLPLGIGQLVQVGGPVVAAVTSITALAGPGDTLVAYVDTFIPVGGESTVVLFGRVLNVPVLDPVNNTLAAGEFLKVSDTSVFEFTDSLGDKVATVLRRTAGGEVMDVLFSPFAASKAIHSQLISLNTVVNPWAAVVIPVPAGSTVNVSNELVVVFSNDITRFAHTANTDSLQYNQNAGTITVSQEGTYEVSIPDLINFTGTLSAIMNLNPFSGSNTFNADLVVIRNSVQNGDEEIISGRFINEVSFDSSRPDIDIDGNILSGFDIPQIYAATEDYYTSPVTPKIIDCEVGDTIRLVFRLFFTNDNTTPQIQDGLITLNYGPFSAHSDTSLTVKRV